MLCNPLARPTLPSCQRSVVLLASSCIPVPLLRSSTSNWSTYTCKQYISNDCDSLVFHGQWTVHEVLCSTFVSKYSRHITEDKNKLNCVIVTHFLSFLRSKKNDWNKTYHVLISICPAFLLSATFSSSFSRAACFWYSSASSSVANGSTLSS